MATRHPPLQDDHNPYKRLTVLSPYGSRGPRGGDPKPQRRVWECNKIKGQKYKQLCVWVGADAPGHKRGSKKTVVTDSGYKQKYNKDYNEFLKELGRPRARRNVRQPNAPYRKPKTVSAAGGSAAGRGGRRRSGARAAAAPAASARRSPQIRSRLVQPRRRRA